MTKRRFIVSVVFCILVFVLSVGALIRFAQTTRVKEDLRAAEGKN